MMLSLRFQHKVFVWSCFYFSGVLRRTTDGPYEKLLVWLVQSGCTFDVPADRMQGLHSLHSPANTYSCHLPFLITLVLGFCLFLKSCYRLGKHSATEQPLTCLFDCRHLTGFRMGTQTRFGADLLPLKRDAEILCMCVRSLSCHCHKY